MRHLPQSFSMIFLAAACLASAAPEYVDEAPLPDGWPKPGPYNETTLKQMPAYRAAFNSNDGRSIGFWSLFSHIKKHDIPMTAPVEMAMSEDEDGSMSMSSMAFLYQNAEVGKTGADGPRVEVRDVPAARVLSYAWQGRDSAENIARAREALDKDLATRKLRASGYRLLGYNGPSTPRDKATWELQALIAD